MIATSSFPLGDWIFAKCTCVIEAAAIGSDRSIILEKISFPNSSFNIFLASIRLKAGNLSWSFSKSFAISLPIISGLVAKNCPNLIKVVPISWSAAHSFSPADKLLISFLFLKLKPII